MAPTGAKCIAPFSILAIRQACSANPIVPRRIAKHVFVRFFFRSVDTFLSVGDRNELYLSRYGAAEERIVRCHLTVDIRRFRETLDSSLQVFG